jgi:Response regulator containing CheY-like receiver, AAA-type ATPase, and DNA-binding domains
MAKILIADDSTVCRTVLSILLTNQGHEVAQASDGREALANLERNTFDIVLLDHDMPHASGTEVLKRLRERSQVPAIIVSGTVSPELSKEYQALKVAEIYGKPVDPKVLRDKIQLLLSGDQSPKRDADLAFEKEIARVKNFPATLTLLGNPRSPFREVLARIVGDAPLIEIQLPEVGGRELLDQVPSDHVIVIPSAADLSESAQAILRDYVVKPKARVVLCVTTSIEMLEDLGFSQALLMRFGTRCLEIPDNITV